MTRNCNSMVALPVNQSEIIDIIKNLKHSRPGWDAISANVVKVTYPCFIEPLAHIMNLSITQGVFPKELKLAKVIPLYKASDPMVFSNYRPVSVLPLFSKILEHLMYTRLLSFINKHKLLYSYQFGFRRGHSPDLALICLVDRIRWCVPRNKIIFMVKRYGWSITSQCIKEYQLLLFCQKITYNRHRIRNRINLFITMLATDFSYRLASYFGTNTSDIWHRNDLFFFPKGLNLRLVPWN